MLHNLLYHQQKFSCGPTAAERLTTLSGGGTAGCLLGSLGAGDSAGAVLTSFSGLAENPASTHLLAPRSGQLTAPSGMRRLELYQLQEEVLNNWGKKKDEQDKGQEAPSRESEGTTSKPVEAAKPRSRRAKRRSPKVEKPIVVPFARPEPSEPTVYELLLSIPWLAFIQTSLTVSQTSVIIDLEAVRRRRSRRRVAAFLLLAA